MIKDVTAAALSLSGSQKLHAVTNPAHGTGGGAANVRVSLKF